MAECSSLVGIPFLFGGRTLAGLDCWGLVMEAFRMRGIEVEDVSDYGALAAAEVSPQIASACAETWRQVEEPYEPYDVLLFSEGTSGAVTHCALYLGNGRMLHTTQRTGAVITRVRSYVHRFAGAWRREALCLA